MWDNYLRALAPGVQLQTVKQKPLWEGARHFYF